MTTSIVIFGWIFLGLMTEVSLHASRCDHDKWWTSENVLVGTDTPVYFIRSDKNSNVGHTLIRQKNAMANLNKQSRWFRESNARRTDISKKCSHYDEFDPVLAGRAIQAVGASCIAPGTIYPKIVVVVDYGIYERYEENLTDLLEYLIAIWNGVDLNFREFEHPKVRLHIAGIVIADRDGGLPFLSPLFMNMVPIFKATDSVVQFMETSGSSWSSHFGHYHIAVVMTSMKTYVHDYDSYTDVSAYHKSRTMCTDIDTLGPASRVLFSDNGRWLRVTRELTYILGNSFESSAHNDGGALCPLDESLVTGNDDKPLWSKCLLDSFKKRLNNKQAKCFYEKPKLTSPLPRVLPGKILDRYQQLMTFGETGCNMDERICQRFSCSKFPFSLPSRFSVGPVYAPDGTPCSTGKICFRRKCMFEKDIE